jgi:hypothetical protein
MLSFEKQLQYTARLTGGFHNSAGLVACSALRVQMVELGLVIFCSGHQFGTSGKVTTGTKDYGMNLLAGHLQ